MRNSLLVSLSVLVLGHVSSAQAQPTTFSDAQPTTQNQGAVRFTYLARGEGGVSGQCEGAQGGILFFAVPTKDEAGQNKRDLSRWCFGVGDHQGDVIAAAGDCWDDASEHQHSFTMLDGSTVTGPLPVHMDRDSRLNRNDHIAACLEAVHREFADSSLWPVETLGNILENVALSRAEANAEVATLTD